VSIDGNGRDLLDSSSIESVDCDFVSRPRITVLIKALCINWMRLGRNACNLGRCNGASEPIAYYDGNAYDSCGMVDLG
jgi:hypothetical protein